MTCMLVCTWCRPRRTANQRQAAWLGVPLGAPLDAPLPGTPSPRNTMIGSWCGVPACPAAGSPRGRGPGASRSCGCSAGCRYRPPRYWNPASSGCSAAGRRRCPSGRRPRSRWCPPPALLPTWRRPFDGGPGWPAGSSTGRPAPPTRRPAPVDQPDPLGSVLLGQKAVHGNVSPVRVSHVGLAVGEGQFLGSTIRWMLSGVLHPRGLEVELLHDVQFLQEYVAAGVGWRLVDRVAVVVWRWAPPNAIGSLPGPSATESRPVPR